jgi:hypothetical protein
MFSVASESSAASDLFEVVVLDEALDEVALCSRGAVAGERLVLLRWR